MAHDIRSSLLPCWVAQDSNDLSSKIRFPTMAGIHYLRNRDIEYFLRLPDAEKYLNSCEGLSGATFATLDERCRGIAKLAQMFPAAITIIGFRRHGGFMASL